MNVNKLFEKYINVSQTEYKLKAGRCDRLMALSDKDWELIHIIQLFRQRLSKESVKAYATMPKGNLGNIQ